MWSAARSKNMTTAAFGLVSWIGARGGGVSPRGAGSVSVMSLSPQRSPAFGSPLPRDFYERHVTEVARDLLGCYLVRRRASRQSEGSIIGGRIVEVEAYGGPGDPGSHADRAPNGRASIMFGPPGIAYVYFTYGMHHCMNAVTDRVGQGSAVLIRALEPVWGTRVMRYGAPTNLADHLVASGPGRLCRSLRIDRAQNGTDLVSGVVRILPRVDEPDVVHEGVRVGLTADDGRLWRFWTDSPSVSRSSRPRSRT
jgi:DNA-3-methyladenine glycosylase